MAKQPALIDPELGPLTDDLLTPEVRVWQRAAGHRFSSDDVATAFCAFRARPDARRVLDLGTGLGSVLLLLAWKLPDAHLVGVEAQAASFELLRRNVARNGLEGRVAARHGDLREPSSLRGVGRFELVTGTPPYFPPGAALDALDAQRTFARVERRGGVEAYIDAAVPCLAPDGRLVLCGDARADARVLATTRELALTVLARCDVVPRAGKAALFSIWEICHGGAPRAPEISTLTLRDALGRQTADASALREFSGFAPLAVA
ncbi:MAG: methyltransferase [Polyangiaceae bacterium]|jgi:tRNA1Val (adenine37-N6)-methyltransferase|nr:methyltransferase [Polyangiaceae bacterium]MBK8940063.1 methyltransferase [Polyangiaceae bacterium]